MLWEYNYKIPLQKGIFMFSYCNNLLPECWPKDNDFCFPQNMGIQEQGYDNTKIPSEGYKDLESET